MNEPTGPDKQVPLLRKSEVWLLLAVTVLFLAGLGTVAAKRLGWFGGPIAVELSSPHSAPVDINNAPWWELATLPGIGQKRAEEIVNLRRQRRGFKTVEELHEVRGISGKTFESLKEFVVVGPYREEVKTESGDAQP